MFAGKKSSTPSEEDQRAALAAATQTETTDWELQLASGGKTRFTLGRPLYWAYNPQYPTREKFAYAFAGLMRIGTADVQAFQNMPHHPNAAGRGLHKVRILQQAVIDHLMHPLPQRERPPAPNPVSAPPDEVPSSPATSASGAAAPPPRRPMPAKRLQPVPGLVEVVEDALISEWLERRGLTVDGAPPSESAGDLSKMLYTIQGSVSELGGVIKLLSQAGVPSIQYESLESPEKCTLVIDGASLVKAIGQEHRNEEKRLKKLLEESDAAGNSVSGGVQIECHASGVLTRDSEEVILGALTALSAASFRRASRNVGGGLGTIQLLGWRYEPTGAARYFELPINGDEVNRRAGEVIDLLKEYGVEAKIQRGSSGGVLIRVSQEDAVRWYQENSQALTLLPGGASTGMGRG